MATSKIAYGGAADLAITALDGNGVGVWASSAIFDNSAAQNIDVIVGGSIQVGAVTLAGTIDIYVAGSWDGTEFTAGVDMGDSDITWGTTGSTHVSGEFDLPLLASISIAATDDNNDIVFGGFSIAQAFGGTMPKKFAIVIENNTDIALHATGTLNHLDTVGITYVSA